LFLVASAVAKTPPGQSARRRVKDESISKTERRLAQ
jgi:hypothetical protein